RGPLERGLLVGALGGEYRDQDHRKVPSVRLVLRSRHVGLSSEAPPRCTPRTGLAHHDLGSTSCEVWSYGARRCPRWSPRCTDPGLGLRRKTRSVPWLSPIRACNEGTRKLCAWCRRCSHASSCVPSASVRDCVLRRV